MGAHKCNLNVAVYNYSLLLNYLKDLNVNILQVTSNKYLNEQFLNNVLHTNI